MWCVGEFLGYFAGANILMEYVFSNAAVARSFTEYLSIAFGENDPNVWRVEVPGLPKDYNMLDFPAVALILILTLFLCHRFGWFNCYYFYFFHSARNMWFLLWCYLLIISFYFLVIHISLDKHLNILSCYVTTNKLLYYLFGFCFLIIMLNH